MIRSIAKFSPGVSTLAQSVFTGLLLALLIGTSGCGSTKVYTAKKTVVHADSVYNVSDVRVFNTRTEAVLADGQATDLKGITKRTFNDMLDKDPAIQVRQVITMDEQELVYHDSTVKSWSELDRLNRQFKSATTSLQKFLADERDTQLKLK
jgi:hypothetical protein